jgi:hypothetical protein
MKALKSIEAKLNITQPEDWYNIKTKDIIQYGGASLLQQYRYSTSHMLSSLYPEIQWDISKYVFIK